MEWKAQEHFSLPEFSMNLYTVLSCYKDNAELRVLRSTTIRYSSLSEDILNERRGHILDRLKAGAEVPAGADCVIKKYGRQPTKMFYQTTVNSLLTHTK